MKKMPTITIGIPAHNEAKNIGFLLRSVLKQRQRLFVIEKIYVVCDGCTDDTEKIAKSFVNTNKKIIIINDKKRLGKAKRLNEILDMSKSDYVFFLDADIVLARTIEIEEMVREFLVNNKINVVAGYQIPAKANSFMEKVNNAAFSIWYDVTTSVNDGNHIYNLHGSVSGLRKSFTNSFRFSDGIVCDAGFLYKMATDKNESGFKLAKRTQIIFNTVSSLHDMRLQGTRSITSCKNNMIACFGEEEMRKEYSIPFRYKLSALVRSFAKNPMYTTLAIIFGMYIRLFPLKDLLINKGYWQAPVSTKVRIITT